MKCKLCVLFLGIVMLMTGCLSTPVKEFNPVEAEFKEISVEDYSEKVGSITGLSGVSTTQLINLYYPSNTFKVTNASIKGFVTITEDDGSTQRNEIEFFSSTRRDMCYAACDDFLSRKKQEDPSFANNLSEVIQNNKYNGKLNLYLYPVISGDAFFGYKIKVVVYDIEGVPTAEQIEKDKIEEQLAAEKKHAEEAAAKKAKIDKLNSQGKTLAKGYVYHGVEEVEKNNKYFVNGALEDGHAYYISNLCLVSYGNGTLARIENGDGFFFSSKSSAVYIDYVNQKVKTDVIDAGLVDLLGTTIEKPIDVIIAAGKGSLKTPVILGLIQK